MILVFSIQKDSLQVDLIKPNGIQSGVLSTDKNELLDSFDTWVQSIALDLKCIEAIAVIYQPASFSLLRGLTAMANSLAWSLEVPIYKVKKPVDDQKELARALKKKMAEKKERSFITPEYYREPNITNSK